MRVTGADVKVQELGTNAAGNFYTRTAFAAPYTAELLRGGVVVAKMQTPQSLGACNACHTRADRPGASRRPERSA